MAGSFSKGLITGGLVGAAAGMLIVPRLDMRNKRRISRVSKKVFRGL